MSSEKKGGVVLPLVLIFLFTVAVVLVGIELYARHQVGNDIAKQVSAESIRTALKMRVRTTPIVVPELACR